MSSKNTSVVGRIITKRMLIDKANSTMVIAAGVAAFLVVFSLVSSKGLIEKIGYQNKIIDQKQATKAQLEDNIKARDQLVKSYRSFTNTSRNVIGGNTVGGGDRDGENGKIILDALPSKYDFPALASSLEKLAQQQGMAVAGLTGTDDEAVQSEQAASSSPEAVAMPFEVKVTGSYVQIVNFLTSLERSIRPVKVLTLGIGASKEGVTATINAETFYQPEKLLEVKKEVLK